MLQERRHFQRLELDSPSVVLLDESKYRPLFDLCEGGLAVGGLAAGRLGEVIPFAFDLPERSGCIRGRAEIVWTNESEHRTGLHFLDLADPSREQLTKWISARACTRKLVGNRKQPTLPTIVTHAPKAPINPILKSSGDQCGTRSGSSLFPHLLSEEFELDENPELGSAEELSNDRKSSRTIVVALALVLLSSGFGLFVYHSLGTRDYLQAKDSTTVEKSPELPSKDALASAGSSSGTSPFSPAPARLGLPGFVVQVGAMRQEANADALAHELQEKNFPAFVFRNGTSIFYRVAVGPYSDGDSLVRVTAKLEKQGFKTILRHWVPE